MIVTIDGPAGAGKSSIARRVAEKLNYEFLDTGALYRAVTLGAIESEIDLHDSSALVQFVSSVDLAWDQMRVYLNGNDVTDQIRTPAVTEAIRFLADQPEVRQQLSKLQRKIVANHDVVTEGRDQGTEVFPNARCKIFLTASPDERARRRQQQMAADGRHVPLNEIRRAQDLRDEQDRNRPIGALCPADDALMIESDGMSPEQVVEKIVQSVRSRLSSDL